MKRNTLGYLYPGGPTDYKFTSDSEKNRRANEFYPMFVKIGEKSGVNPDQILAQWALETGWGEFSGAAKESNSLFGMKATGGSNDYWSGDKVTYTTQEVDSSGSSYVTNKEKFRAYDSIEDSVEDYVRLIEKNYPTIDSLEEYATDPNYVAKVEEIMGQFEK